MSREAYLRQKAIQKAGHSLAYAVASGKVVKPDKCQFCAKQISDPSKLQGHHFDYDDPRVVQWVCIPCHRIIHKERRMLAAVERAAGLS